MEFLLLTLIKALRLSLHHHFHSWSTQVQITAVADPVSEPTQRMAPLLRALRDELKLPLTLILAPRLSSDGEDKIPIASYYRFVADPLASPDINPPKAYFSNLPANHVLTLRMDVPEPWNVQQSHAVQDTDNLRCDIQSGCSDGAYAGDASDVPILERRDLTVVEYGLRNLLFFGQCYDATSGSPPNGLQLTLTRKKAAHSSALPSPGEVVVGPDGSLVSNSLAASSTALPYSDTLVMKNVGYWQLRANPGVWDLKIAPDSRGAEIFDMVEGKVVNRKLKVVGPATSNSTQTIVMKDFVNRGELLTVKRRPGYEKATLFYKTPDQKAKEQKDDEVINVFSLATGHLYERFLKIMMLSVTKRTSSKVKFWLFENFLSPTFKETARAMAERIGCEVEFVTYKWPEWVRGQSEKQRIIWGYKILFLDVLFPLNVKKIIYVDADQVIRGDLKELWDMDLQGAPYGYTPFCTSREETLGFQFWRSGFWKNHLGDRPYHISALYVVDLEKFRQDLVGDMLRSFYQQLSADPNSLANLDQDLPNYAQSHVPIFSLPQEWLWCESWCSDETKATAKTIDLCNNPLHKEPKVSMAKRIISGELFNESWVELDEEQELYTQEFLASLQEKN
jgi:UDP-glucose:glycoprotein glucosyltransferase